MPELRRDLVLDANILVRGVLGHRVRSLTPTLFAIAARLAEHARDRRLHLSAHAPWTGLLTQMITTLQTLPAPG